MDTTDCFSKKTKKKEINKSVKIDVPDGPQGSRERTYVANIRPQDVRCDRLETTLNRIRQRTCNRILSFVHPNCCGE